MGFLLLLLSGCGGVSGGELTCTEQYWDGTIGTCVPEGWEIVTREKMTEQGLPSEVIAAFQRGDTISGQTPVFLVTRETLSEEMDAKAYSDASIRSVAVLPAYKQVDARNADIDGDDVQIHIFTAQPVSEEPARRYYQLSATKAKEGFTFTALAPVSVPASLDKEILFMLNEATLMEPVEE